jgi:tetratricopeptide (TPR) repeat protein
MAYLKKMEQLFSEKKYAELKAFCKDRLQITPDDPDVVFYYASALEAMGEHHAARNAFERLHRITKDLLFMICEAIPEFMDGQRDEAVSILKKATMEDEKESDLFLIFRIAAERGETEIASDALIKAYRNDPQKTLQDLQVHIEGLHEQRPERARLFVTVLRILMDIAKKQ